MFCIVKTFDVLRYVIAGKGVSEYDNANRNICFSFCKDHNHDGEVIFLATNSECKVRGIGTVLLCAFEKQKKSGR